MLLNMTDNFAGKHAVELAKIALANPNVTYEVNKDTANKIADFIEILENRFTNKND